MCLLCVCKARVYTGLPLRYGTTADQPELAGARKHRPVLVSVLATDEPLILSGINVNAKSLLLTPPYASIPTLSTSHSKNICALIRFSFCWKRG